MPEGDIRLREDMIVLQQVWMDESEIRQEEIDAVVKRMKRRKATGPDGIPLEWIKELGSEEREGIRRMMNEWWEAGEIPEGLTDARVVHIFKKGRTSDFENYRPISLLNTFYKIFAAIMKDRMAKGLDKHIQTVQYGFMKGR